MTAEVSQPPPDGVPSFQPTDLGLPSGETRAGTAPAALHDALFEAVADALLLIDTTTGRILDVNSAAVTLYGYTRDQLLQRQDTDFSTEPAPTRHAAAEDRSPVPLRYHRRQDGTVVPVEITARHFTWQERPVHLATIRDITPRLQAEQALCESEERYRALFEKAGDYVLVLERAPEGLLRIVDANAAALQVHGYTREEVVGHPLSMLDPETTPESAAERLRALERGVPLLFAVRHRRKDSSVFDAEVRPTPVRMGARTVILSVERDVTARKDAEAALRESEMRRRLTLDAAHAGTWEWDLRTNENVWSEEMWALYGLEPQSCAPSYDAWRQSVHPEDRAGAEASVQAAARTGSELNAEWRVGRPDGTERWLMSRGRPLRDAAGQPVRYLGIVVDITERKQAEEALADRTRQLEAVRAVSQEITHELDLDVLLNLILRRAVDLVGAEGGTILFWDEANQVLIPQVHSEFLDVLEWKNIPVGQGVVGQVAASRTGLLVNDYRAWPGALPATREHTAVTASLAEPLLYRDRLVGVINVAYTQDHATFTERDGHVLRLFATQAAIAIENARLYREERRRREHLEALRSVGEEITREMRLPTLLQLILEHAMRMVGAVGGSVLLRDEASGLLVPSVWVGRPPATHARQIALGEGVSGTVAAQRKGMIVNDYRHSPFARPAMLAQAQITAAIAEPLLYQDRLVGVINLDNGDTRRTFSAEAGEILRLFATQAAIAIENARLHEATVRHAREQEALLQAARSLMKGLPLSEMLDRICKAAALVATTPHVKILLADKAANVLRLAFASGGPVPNGFSVPIGTSYSGTVAATGEILFIPDTQNDPANLLRERDRAHGIRTYLGLPITAEGEVLGVITFNTEEPHEYSRDEMEHLSSFADLAAVAIERTRLHETVEHRAGQLALLTDLTQRLMAPLDLQPLGEEILRAVQALVPGAFGRLWDMGENDDTLHLIASVGLQDALGGTVRFRQGEGLAGLAAAAKRPMTSRDITQDPRFVNREWAVREGLHAAVVLPLIHQERLYGILAVFTREVREFGEEDVRILQALANHAAIAIENARLYTTTQQALADVQHAQGELVRAETLRGLGQMAAGIAHDLNNTLATVLGQTELAKLAAPPPELQEILALIETAAADGAAVVRRVQEFARPKGTSPLAPCDLAALVRETLELTRPRWQAEPQRRGVSIAVELALDGLPPILGHPPELREALTNLVFNAVDAMPHGGTLTLAARVVDRWTGGTTLDQWTSGVVDAGEPIYTATSALLHQSTAPPVHPASSWVELTVTDSGIGMPPEVQAKVFEPFFTTKGFKGTGLGLALVYGILERHGGRITVTSALGQGTTFTLTFQRVAAPAEPATPVAAFRLTPSRHVLVIDDDPLVRKTLAALLQAAGHHVRDAVSGPAGLALLADEAVDLVLTDLGMPGMNGWEVARAIKAIYPTLPIVLLTGWQEQAPGEEADRQAVDLILGKPVPLDVLRRVVSELTAPDDTALAGEAPPRV